MHLCNQVNTTYLNYDIVQSIPISIFTEYFIYCLYFGHWRSNKKRYGINCHINELAIADKEFVDGKILFHYITSSEVTRPTASSLRKKKHYLTLNSVHEHKMASSLFSISVIYVNNEIKGKQKEVLSCQPRVTVT